MHYVAHELDVVNAELALVAPFLEHLIEEFLLVGVETFAHLFHQPDVAEKLGAQVAVAYNHLLNHVEVRINQQHHLLLRVHVHRGYFLQLVAQQLEFRLYYSVVNLLLVLEIRVQRAPAFLRSHCYHVHRCSLQPVLCEKLARDVY